LLAEAKSLLHENGSLSEAALLLEAAIQKGELGEGGYETWILLGETRNMDEREDAGIKALTEGVRRAQEAGVTGPGMMVCLPFSCRVLRFNRVLLQALAISYTNESYERAAYTMLLRWLSATHPSAEIPPETWESLKQSSWHSRDLVSQAFLNIARSQHSQGILDPNVQAGLGVLFYSFQ
jgi:peroxin-5